MGGPILTALRKLQSVEVVGDIWVWRAFAFWIVASEANLLSSQITKAIAWNMRCGGTSWVSVSIGVVGSKSLLRSRYAVSGNVHMRILNVGSARWPSVRNLSPGFSLLPGPSFSSMSEDVSSATPWQRCSYPILRRRLCRTVKRTGTSKLQRSNYCGDVPLFS